MPTDDVDDTTPEGRPTLPAIESHDPDEVVTAPGCPDGFRRSSDTRPAMVMVCVLCGAMERELKVDGPAERLVCADGCPTTPGDV